MKTNTIYLFLVSLLTLLVAGGFAVYVSKQIIAKTEAVKTQHAKDIQNKNIDLGTKLKKESLLISEQEKIIENAFLNQNEVVSFISNTESLAEKLSLKFAVEKVDRGAEEAIGQTYKIQPITLSLSIDGSFEQIKYFIEQLMNSQKIISIKEFKIYKMGESATQYNARIIITSTILSL